MAIPQAYISQASIWYHKTLGTQSLGNADRERCESRSALKYFEESILVLHVLATIQKCVRLVNNSVQVKL